MYFSITWNHEVAKGLDKAIVNRNIAKGSNVERGWLPCKRACQGSHRQPQHCGLCLVGKDEVATSAVLTV